MNSTSIYTQDFQPGVRRTPISANAVVQAVLRQLLSLCFQNKWLSRSPMLQRRVYHSMAAVQRKLYVLGGNDLDYNNDRILVRHIDSYSIDTDQWTRCSFNMLTGKYCIPKEENCYC